MTAPLVFMDTETTGLSIADDIWEFAAIRREPDGNETEFHIFIEHSRSKCERLPTEFRDDHYSRYLDHLAYTRKQACELIASVFRNGEPHVVGAVPNFDTERIVRMVHEHYPAWKLGWHYHLIDVENLAVGYLFARYEANKRIYRELMPAGPASIALPWDSDELSKQIGVDPSQFERHTAMGDARWARAIYDAVTGGPR